MLRVIFCLLAVVAIAYSPAWVQATDKKKEQDRPKAQKQDGEKKAKADKKPKADKAKKHPMVTGEVKAVDAEAKTITIIITNKKKKTSIDKVFTVADDATVTIKGEAKTLADIVAGEKARLKLSDDGQKVIVSIEVGRAKKVKKAD